MRDMWFASHSLQFHEKNIYFSCQNYWSGCCFDWVPPTVMNNWNRLWINSWRLCCWKSRRRMNQCVARYDYGKEIPHFAHLSYFIWHFPAIVRWWKCWRMWIKDLNHVRWFSCPLSRCSFSTKARNRHFCTISQSFILRWDFRVWQTSSRQR